MAYSILLGDCRDTLKTLPDGSVRCVVTSPPYFGLRDYGTAEWEGGSPECDHSRFLGGNGQASAKQVTSAGTQAYQYRGTCGKCGARRVDRQIGLEPTPDEFVAALVEVFCEVRRVLADDGIVWLNMADSYGAGTRSTQVGQTVSNGSLRDIPPQGRVSGFSKQLLGIPWRVALALQADGWILRSDIITESELYCPCGCGVVLEERIVRYGQDGDIIWKKPNPMPESVRDRPTKAHEYVFLLAKKPNYFYDAEAVREDFADERMGCPGVPSPKAGMIPGQSPHSIASKVWNADGTASGRNLRTVWKITPKPFKGSHFATFPVELAARCIKAGTSERGRCPECGRPWVRVVEREPMVLKPSGRAEAMGEYGRTCTSGTMASPPRSMTIGWRPTCDHGREPVPDVVLDPFAGAGTTLLAADRLGRDAIGCELNPAYRAMALERIAGDEPLPLIEAAEAKAQARPDPGAPLPGQLDLFP